MFEIKKIVFILICCISISINAFAIRVMGIESLTPKDEVLEAVHLRYGYLKVSDKGNEIVITEPCLGVTYFKLGFLYFSYIAEKNRFNGASFQNYFKSNENEQAKAFRDQLMSRIKDKYGENYWEYTNEQGFKCCDFGKQSNRPVGSIILERGEGKDGVTRLYVILTYFQFVDTSLDDF